MKLRHFTKLHTDFDPDECCHRLRESINSARRTIFPVPGVTGSEPIIGRLNGYQFCLEKRRNYRNSFAPQARGTFVPRERGTLIECYFDMPRWVKLFTRIWLALAILASAQLFVDSLNTLRKRGNFNGGDPYIGLIVPIMLVLFGIFLPKFGLWLGKSEEVFILEFLERTLFANRTELDRIN